MNQDDLVAGLIGAVLGLLGFWILWPWTYAWLARRRERNDR